MKKVLKITESQYRKLLLFEQGDEKEFKMDYKKLKNNPSPEYIAAVIKNSKGKWNDEEAWAQSAFEAIKDLNTYNKVKQILKSDPYKFVKSFMDTDASRDFSTKYGLDTKIVASFCESFATHVHLPKEKWFKYHPPIEVKVV